MEVKQKVGSILEGEGVELVLGSRASIAELPNGKYEVTLANGKVLTADAVLNTTKKGSATTGFLPAECLNDEDEIKITPMLQFSSDIPNAKVHFGVGDVVEWSGIKRAGGAMVMGQLAACNLYATILNDEDKSNNPLCLAELPTYENVIGIAIGKQCLTYDATNGIKSSEQLLKDYFGDDLGWAANLRYLKLTDMMDESAKEAEKVSVAEVVLDEVPATA